MKKISLIKKDHSSHWVGDGFPVRSVFSYHHMAEEISPFLLMDYAGPAVFEPSEHIRGVGLHPHRGFETVTIVYNGEIEHHDSAGGGGLIKQGDVQWMTAASGLVHEEKHSRDFASVGGAFEMIQLWVNLPKKYKMTQPKYQEILNAHIPRVALNQSGSFLRVIAGEFEQQKGPSHTFTPINLWDVFLQKGDQKEFMIPGTHNTLIFVMSGEIEIGGESVNNAELAILDHSGDRFKVAAKQDTKALILSGEPILEPIAGYGPFVMNTPAEIEQAFSDFRQGKMG